MRIREEILEHLKVYVINIHPDSLKLVIKEAGGGGGGGRGSRFYIQGGSELCISFQRGNKRTESLKRSRRIENECGKNEWNKRPLFSQTVQKLKKLIQADHHYAFRRAKI